MGGRHKSALEYLSMKVKQGWMRVSAAWMELDDISKTVVLGKGWKWKFTLRSKKAARSYISCYSGYGRDGS